MYCGYTKASIWHKRYSPFNGEVNAIDLFVLRYKECNYCRLPVELHPE